MSTVYSHRILDHLSTEGLVMFVPSFKLIKERLVEAYPEFHGRREPPAIVKKEDSEERCSLRRDSGVGDNFDGSSSSLTLSQDSEVGRNQDPPRSIPRVIGFGDRGLVNTENRQN